MLYSRWDIMATIATVFILYLCIGESYPAPLPPGGLWPGEPFPMGPPLPPGAEPYPVPAGLMGGYPGEPRSFPPFPIPPPPAPPAPPGSYNQLRYGAARPRMFTPWNAGNSPLLPAMPPPPPPGADPYAAARSWPPRLYDTAPIAPPQRIYPPYPQPPFAAGPRNRDDDTGSDTTSSALQYLIGQLKSAVDNTMSLILNKPIASSGTNDVSSDAAHGTSDVIHDTANGRRRFEHISKTEKLPDDDTTDEDIVTPLAAPVPMTTTPAPMTTTVVMTTEPPMTTTAGEYYEQWGDPNFGGGKSNYPTELEELQDGRLGENIEENNLNFDDEEEEGKDGGEIETENEFYESDLRNEYENYDDEESPAYDESYSYYDSSDVTEDPYSSSNEENEDYSELMMSEEDYEGSDVTEDPYESWNEENEDYPEELMTSEDDSHFTRNRDNRDDEVPPPGGHTSADDVTLEDEDPLDPGQFNYDDIIPDLIFLLEKEIEKEREANSNKVRRSVLSDPSQGPAFVGPPPMGPPPLDQPLLLDDDNQLHRIWARNTIREHRRRKRALPTDWRTTAWGDHQTNDQTGYRGPNLAGQSLTPANPQTDQTGIGYRGPSLADPGLRPANLPFNSYARPLGTRAGLGASHGQFKPYRPPYGYHRPAQGGSNHPDPSNTGSNRPLSRPPSNRFWTPGSRVPDNTFEQERRPIQFPRVDLSRDNNVINPGIRQQTNRNQDQYNRVMTIRNGKPHQSEPAQQSSNEIHEQASWGRRNRPMRVQGTNDAHTLTNQNAHRESFDVGIARRPSYQYAQSSYHGDGPPSGKQTQSHTGPDVPNTYPNYRPGVIIH